MSSISIPNGAKDIIAKLHRHGFKAYLVGGCVRDFVMKRRPADWDIVTSAHPEDITRLFKSCNLVGAKFGVVRVRVKGREYEVAAFRKDMPTRDGRHPSAVKYCGEKEDVLRRDFTVNGLLYDLKRKRIIDYSAGQKDIRQKIIRTIGEPKRRFKEDYLRMLRAVRFACQLEFTIQPKTLNAIRPLAPDISLISPERIRDELTNILTGPSPKTGLRILHDTGLLKVVLPEVDAMIGVLQPKEFHKLGDVFNHTLGLFDNVRRPSLALVWGALLHDVGKPRTQTFKERIRFDGHVEAGTTMAVSICRRLRFSSKITDQIASLVANHMRFMDVTRMRESTLKRFLRMDHFPLHLELHRMDCLASHGDLSNWKFCKKKLAVFQKKQEAEALKPRPLLSGHDLIRLGYTPGPLFSEILNNLETQQLECALRDKTQAQQYVKDHWPIG